MWYQIVSREANRWKYPDRGMPREKSQVPGTPREGQAVLARVHNNTQLRGSLQFSLLTAYFQLPNGLGTTLDHITANGFK